MRIKTTELKDQALDWVVANCLPEPKSAIELLDRDVYNGFDPSINWAQAGPIIDRELINLRAPSGGESDVYPNGMKLPGRWSALKWAEECIATTTGPTPLIAAMRCFVKSKLGDEVDVPDELCANLKTSHASAIQAPEPTRRPMRP